MGIHDLAIWKRLLLLLFASVPFVFALRSVKRGSIDLRGIPSISRKEHPGRFWFNVVGGFLMGALLMTFIIFKILGGSNGN